MVATKARKAAVVARSSADIDCSSCSTIDFADDAAGVATACSALASGLSPSARAAHRRASSGAVRPSFATRLSLKSCHADSTPAQQRERALAKHRMKQKRADEQTSFASDAVIVTTKRAAAVNHHRLQIVHQRRR